MNDPRQHALGVATRWLDTARRRPLVAAECAELVDALGLVPGLLRTAVGVLSCQRDGAAIDALLLLPAGVPGWVEALFGAFAAGVVRQRVDGRPSTPMLALDFMQSKAAGFEETMARARHVFGTALEDLRVEGRIHHRFMLEAGRGTLAGRAAAVAHDVQWLHGRLGRQRTTRTWINGWCFTADGKVRPPVQIHLVRAWLTWAARQVTTAP